MRPSQAPTADSGFRFGAVQSRLEIGNTNEAVTVEASPVTVEFTYWLEIRRFDYDRVISSWLTTLSKKQQLNVIDYLKRQINTWLFKFIIVISVNIDDVY